MSGRCLELSVSMRVTSVALESKLQVLYLHEKSNLGGLVALCTTIRAHQEADMITSDGAR